MANSKAKKIHFKTEIYSSFIAKGRSSTQQSMKIHCQCNEEKLDIVFDHWGNIWDNGCLATIQLSKM